MDDSNNNNFFAPGQPGGPPLPRTQSQPFGMLTPSAGLPMGHPGAAGQRYYTIQRVNGNGGNGKGDGVAGPHKHTLEESDRVKRNSVQRHVVKEEKEKKKTQVSVTVELNHLRESGGTIISENNKQRQLFSLRYVIDVHERLGNHWWSCNKPTLIHSPDWWVLPLTRCIV